MSKSLLDELLYTFSQRVADTLHLPHLADHFPTMILSFLTWNTVQYILSPYFSPYLSTAYAEYARHGRKRGMTAAQKANVKREERQKGIKSLDGWHSHSVGLLHAVVVIPLAIGCLHLPALEGTRERAFGWDDRIGLVHAISCGYFLWDILDCVLNYESIGFVLHAVACLTVFLLGYRPFLAYYGPRFLLWELSTPFLNLNWFLERTPLKGGRLHLINGVSLLVTFFFARLIYGTYMSYNFYKTCYFNRDEIPGFLLWTYSIGNLILNGLNWFWYSKMLNTTRRRFSTQAVNGQNGHAATKDDDVRMPRSVSAKALGHNNPRMRTIG